MITDDLQYRVTKAHAARFDEALRNLEADQGPDRKRRELEIAAVRAQLGDLHAELARYDELRSGMIRSFDGVSLPELAVAFIKARIAKGWSRRRLAEELGITEQQIQRYESSCYTSASLARLCDVVAALGVEVGMVVSLPGTDAA